MWSDGPPLPGSEDMWLYRLDPDTERVQVLLDPDADAPGLTPPSFGSWRICSYRLRDPSELSEQPEEITEEIAAAVYSVLGQEPSVTENLTCEQALRVAGPSKRAWVCLRTEEALHSLSQLPAAAIDGYPLTSAKLRRADGHLKALGSLLEDWKRAGGRSMFLRLVVEALDRRRASLLRVLEAQPSSNEEWLAMLRHRLIDQTMLVSSAKEMPAELADEIAWSAAIALEIAFILTAQSSQATVEEMLDEAGSELERALDHGHDSPAEWVSCALHCALDDENSELEAIVATYAHLAGHLVHSRCAEMLLSLPATGGEGR